MSDEPGNKLSEDLKVELVRQYRFQWEAAQDSFKPLSAGQLLPVIENQPDGRSHSPSFCTVCHFLPINQR